MSWGPPCRATAVVMEPPKKANCSELVGAALFAAHTMRSIAKQIIALADYIEGVAKRRR